MASTSTAAARMEVLAVTVMIMFANTRNKNEACTLRKSSLGRISAGGEILPVR